MVLGARARVDADRARRRQASAPRSCSSASCSSRAGDARFEGEVSGVIGAGAFVRFGGELADVYEGFLPARRMRGEHFDLNETETALVGRRSGRDGAARRPGRGPGRRDRGAARAGSTSCPADGRERGDEQARQAQGRPPATSRPTAGPATRTSSLERFECGIELQGTEVKSLREGKSADRRRLRGDRGAARSGCETPTSRPTRRPQREPRARAPAQAAAAPLRDRAPDRPHAAQGADPVPTRIYFKGPRAKVELALAPRQGAPRPPPRDPRPRHAARGRARAARPPAGRLRPVRRLSRCAPSRWNARPHADSAAESTTAGEPLASAALRHPALAAVAEVDRRPSVPIPMRRTRLHHGASRRDRQRRQRAASEAQARERQRSAASRAGARALKQSASETPPMRRRGAPGPHGSESYIGREEPPRQQIRTRGAPRSVPTPPPRRRTRSRSPPQRAEPDERAIRDAAERDSLTRLEQAVQGEAAPPTRRRARRGRAANPARASGGRN